MEKTIEKTCDVTKVLSASRSHCSNGIRRGDMGKDPYDVTRFFSVFLVNYWVLELKIDIERVDGC